MEDAARTVLNGNVCDVDVEVIKSNFKQEEEEQDKFERILSMIRTVRSDRTVCSTN
jgi:hypothetical protein